MRIETNLAGPGSLPDHDGPLLAAVDVEWTKNYQVRNGNIPFCYSIVYLPLPADQTSLADGDPVPAWFTAAYVDTPEETGELVELAGHDLAAALDRAGWLTGHQLSSDLAILATAAGGQPPTAITVARAAWHARPRTPALPVELDQGRCQVLDTRYDAGHLLNTTSRRLVDVCTDLRLDVTQPELRGSMTAMHRQWLATRTVETQERIAVLNLRHSLSTALVALHALGRAGWPAPFNINRLLGPLIAGRYPVWLTHPTFVALTAERGGRDVDQRRHRRIDRHFRVPQRHHQAVPGVTQKQHALETLVGFVPALTSPRRFDLPIEGDVMTSKPGLARIAVGMGSDPMRAVVHDRYGPRTCCGWGRYRAVIDRCYPLEQVAEATRYVETEQKTENVVLTLDGDRAR